MKLPWAVIFLGLIVGPCCGKVKYVHVVQSNHLDVGFDGIAPTVGFAINVINRYFDVYFPAAVNTSQYLRKRGGTERLIYSTQPWLVALYLQCSPNAVPLLPAINESLHCPTDAQHAAFDQAISLGDITWHAMPFNMEPEIMDPSFLAYASTIAHGLDVKYGRNLTQTMSQRDVPGMTRSVIPVLRSVGIEAISVGVNGGSAPPAVPSAFVWSDGTNDIIAMEHPGGYGGIRAQDCVTFPGFDHALALDWRGDNAGPPDADQVIADFKQLQSEFPDAEIKASTFDEFLSHLKKIRDKLPVVTQEIGDTWVYGVASDPLRLAQFRTILRLRTACVASGQCQASDPRFQAFNFLLVKVPEHTWGLDVKTFLADFVNWTNKEFEAARSGANYQLMETSWQEQRAYITAAIAALGDHPLAAAIQSGLAALQPYVPSTEGYTKVTDPAVLRKCGDLVVGFDPATGAIASLFSQSSNLTFADETHMLGQYRYQTFEQANYTSFLDEYMYCTPENLPCWIVHDRDFGKPNVSLGDPHYGVWLPTLRALWVRQNTTAGTCSFLADLAMDPDANQLYGAPANLWVQSDLASAGTGSVINITVQLFNKTATRLPEASWFSFRPINLTSGSAASYWMMDKLGEPVSPMDVRLNGSNHIHGILSGVSFHVPTELLPAPLLFQSLDAGIVNPGELSPFPTPFRDPDISQGMNFLLSNNIWGTNYIMWYPFAGDAASLYRLSIIIPT